MKKAIKFSLVVLSFALAIGFVYFVGDTFSKDVSAVTQTPTTTKRMVKIVLGTPVVKVKKQYEKHVKLDWNNIDYAKNYKVFRATKGKSFVQVANVKKSSYTDKNAKKRVTYKYKIVAEGKVQGQTLTSSDSKVKTVYTLPSNPRIVICGECFVEGMKLYAKKYKPKNTHIIAKIGISTSGMLNDSYINYKGSSITAIERIAYYNPDRVYFLIGMNEAKGGNPSRTVNNYKKAFKLLKSVNPNIEMVLMALPPVARSHSSGFASNGKINRYNRAYKKYASKTKNVFYYSRYRRLISDGAGYLKTNAKDGGHWSSGGTIKVVKDLKKHSKALTKR